MGFFKKVVIADTMRVAVDRAFNMKEPTVLLLFAAALGFTLQILADFSAYTDLARGVARLFGFETTENFRSPYLSLTPTDFWNRWHITLSTWLRDYIFFPLRRALLRARWPGWLADALPPLAAMFVSGLWHGAGWTYAVWGLYFGVLIVVYQAIGMGGAWRPANKATRFFAWLTMFLLLVFSFAVFRASTLGWLIAVLTRAPLLGSVEYQAVALATFSMTLFYAAPLLVKSLMDRRLSADSIWRDVYLVGATLAMLAFLNASAPDFIYFQF